MDASGQTCTWARDWENALRLHRADLHVLRLAAGELAQTLKLTDIGVKCRESSESRQGVGLRVLC
jgi:hypothetical protein